MTISLWNGNGQQPIGSSKAAFQEYVTALSDVVQDLIMSRVVLWLFITRSIPKYKGWASSSSSSGLFVVIVCFFYFEFVSVDNKRRPFGFEKKTTSS